MTKKLRTYADLFGRKVRVELSTDPSLKGLEGIFWDETLRTITIKTPRGLKTLLKESVAKMLVEGANGRLVEVSGWDLVKRPYERLKDKYAAKGRR